MRTATLYSTAHMTDDDGKPGLDGTDKDHFRGLIPTPWRLNLPSMMPFAWPFGLLRRSGPHPH